jgi:hypothetical protein
LSGMHKHHRFSNSSWANQDNRAVHRLVANCLEE